MTRITELRDCRVGLESFEANGHKFWRMTFQDGKDVTFADIPDHIARAMAVKISTGKTIEIAGEVPTPNG